MANERTTFADAFKMADDVLASGVRGVTDLMIMPGLINLDFADIRAVMSEMGKAMMGTGEAEGDRRSIDAAEAAISNPLLEDVSMKGARGVLINITGGLDMTLFEVDEAANRIREEVDPDANIIFGSTFDEKLEGRMRISVVATGIDLEAGARAAPGHQPGERPPRADARPSPRAAPSSPPPAPPSTPRSPQPVAAAAAAAPGPFGGRARSAAGRRGRAGGGRQGRLRPAQAGRAAGPARGRGRAAARAAARPPAAPPQQSPRRRPSRRAACRACSSASPTPAG